ncbi:MAG TPA: hypothetical protein VF665_20465 [Longimicrobium sp.]|uniref:hypothetical protein n=1 Tax=Longimicrobium sp. TaxID=2029185 RepID=UPI002EDB48E3
MQKMTRLLVAAALALPCSLAAQATPAAPPAQAAPQAEMVQIQTRLAQLQDQALQDTALVAAGEALNRDLMAAAASLDTAAAGRIARAETLGLELQAAQIARDTVKLAALTTEAEALSTYFEQLTPRVMALPAMAAKQQAYVDRLIAVMTRLDAQVPTLIARLDQLRGVPAAAPGN